nr:hypothetical protein [Tanacetum cinerariifolium]
MDKETCKEIMPKEDIKDEYQENEKDIDISEKSQSGGKYVTSSQNVMNEDIKETTIAQYVTVARDYEDREMPEKIVNDISSTEQEEYIKEIKPKVKNLSNSLDVNQNEKDISFLSNDEVKENEKELNISEQDQGKDEVTCSHDSAATSKVELQGKYEDGDAKQKLVETREIPKEYNEVIQTSGETEGKMKQQIESKK